MKNQKEIINIVSKCLKVYDFNLKNKDIMFVLEGKDKSLSKEEVFFPKSCFYHLTGIKIVEKNGRVLNSYEFYDNIKDNTISTKKYIIKRKDNTADLKLQVLPQLMRIDKISNMLGEFNNYNIYLKTEKLAGNVNACMGFKKDIKLNIYVPNTALKKDIREITNNRSKIIAILKKKHTDKLYSCITYLKQNYKIYNILENQAIKKYIDIDRIYSNNKKS